jgi:hypothetical protein
MIETGIDNRHELFEVSYRKFYLSKFCTGNVTAL